MAATLKTALVTGASKGVGRGIALVLAEHGWDVVINYNSDKAGAEETAAALREHGRQAWIVQADVGYSDQVAAMFNQADKLAPPLDLLVNNSGVQTWAPLTKLREEDFDRTIRTNLKGCFLCTQQAARRMIDRGQGGSIINIGSGANKLPFPNLVDYNASKGGIDNLTLVTAVELGPHKIRVNCVAPGAIEIERTKLESSDYAGTWGPLTPLRRVGTPRDVGNVVAYLASPAADFITAQTIYVDGGLMSQGPWPYKE